jgi:hypothetical protein
MDPYDGTPPETSRRDLGSAAALPRTTENQGRAVKDESARCIPAPSIPKENWFTGDYPPACGLRPASRRL